MIMLKIFFSIYMFDSQFKKGGYIVLFTYGTSELWEVGEVIEKISTSRFFLNLLNLFV